MWIKRNVDSRVPEPQNTDDIIVRCVTVHKSKGLEYGSVILPYCSASINGSYEDGARVVIETVKEWASRNIKKVEWIVLVDIYGKFITR